MFMGEETQGVDHLSCKGYFKSFHIVIKALIFTNRMISNTITIEFLNIKFIHLGENTLHHFYNEFGRKIFYTPWLPLLMVHE